MNDYHAFFFKTGAFALKIVLSIAIAALYFNCGLAFVFGQTESADSPVAQIETPTNTMDRLIERLGSDEYLEREQARQELAELGAAAKSCLRQAINNPDPEIVLQARFLLESIPDNWVHVTDSPELKLWLERYQKYDIFLRALSTDSLARLPLRDRAEGTLRLLELEPSESQAFLAAVVFWMRLPQEESVSGPSSAMTRDDNGSNSRKEILALLRARLSESQFNDNMGAQCLRLLMDYPQSGKESSRFLESIAERRDEVLISSQDYGASAISWYIGFSLARLAFDQEEKKAENASENASENAAGNASENASENGVEKPGEDPGSLLCFGRPASQSRKTLSPELFKSARVIELLQAAYSSEGMVPDMGMALLAYLPLLGPLELLNSEWPDRDRVAQSWIEWELRLDRDSQGAYCINGHIIEDSTMAELIVSLAETLHDRGQDRLAAFVMGQISSQLLKQTSLARLEYYLACQAKQENRPRECWNALVRALKQDPEEVDSIILRWELCQMSDEEAAQKGLQDVINKQAREDCEKVINDLLESIEKQLKTNRNSSNLQNEYAWLAVKTNRNLQKAVNYALNARANNAQSAACTDTLAHAMAAINDWNAAITAQNTAIALDPFSETIYQALVRFQEQAKRFGKQPPKQ